MKPIMYFETDIEVLIRCKGQPSVRNWCATLMVASGQPAPLISQLTVGRVFATVNHSRWIAKCSYCAGGAMLASKRERIFWCPNCEMQANGGYPMQVIFPKDMEMIEQVLTARPDPATRNWLLHETIADLVRENTQHGVK